MIKKKLILFGIAILTIILVIFIFQPHQLPRDLCISDSQCTHRLSPNSCDEYQCNNIFWRPAEDLSKECSLEPEPPNCGCVDFHCEKTDMEYSGCHCNVNGKGYTCEEYQDLKWGEKTVDFDPIKEESIRCRCYPKEGKDKFVIIMEKDSQFYSEELKSKLDEYLEAIKSDVGIENIGVLFFEGDSYAFKEKLHSLYLEQDLGYVLLIGNDLLEILDGIRYDDNEMHLAFRGDYTLPFGEFGCPNIVISVLPVPPNSNLNKQKKFISDQIDNYIRFHKNPESYLSNFSRNYIRIVNLDVSIDYTTFDPSSPDIEPDIKYHWGLPKRDILSSNSNLKSEIIKEKPMIFDIMGHGWTRIMAWRVTPEASPLFPNSPIPPGQDPVCMGTTDEWLNFTKDFTPSVLIVRGGCGRMVVNDYNTSSDRYLAEFCCWPQAFLKSGALGYMSESHPRLYDLTGSDFFGQALLKNPIRTEYFGDLFAHL